MFKPKPIELIILHCSATKSGDVDIFRNYHVKTKGWRDVGYNGVITNGFLKNTRDYNREMDGGFQIGRGLDLSQTIEWDEKAAHTLDYNDVALGICLTGLKEFTVNQFKTALHFCLLFKAINPKIEVKGHYEMPTARGKTCPNFDMNKFRYLLKNGLVQNKEIQILMNSNDRRI